MPDDLNACLPGKSSWQFDDIACKEPDRAALLEKAESPSALVEGLCGALDQPLDEDRVRFGREHVRDDCRIVVQFHVGDKLFDWFFNARTGYRAHFRAHHNRGIEFNNEIIEELRLRLDAKLPKAFCA